MEINDWNSIWSSKDIDISMGDVTLSQLIKLDGFDTGYGDQTVESWNVMCKHISEIIHASESSKVLEVGCGSGALLYSIKEIINCEVFGVDYSKSLISIAERYVEGTFYCSPADSFDFFRPIKFDAILSHSVFQYFSNKTYAHEVLIKCFDSLLSGGYLLISDINDAELKEEFERERSIEFGSIESYRAHYAGLPHLFYTKEWFKCNLEAIGFHDVNILQLHSDSVNSKYRFSIRASKS